MGINWEEMRDAQTKLAFMTDDLWHHIKAFGDEINNMRAIYYDNLDEIPYDDLREKFIAQARNTFDIIKAEQYDLQAATSKHRESELTEQIEKLHTLWVKWIEEISQFEAEMYGE